MRRFKGFREAFYFGSIEHNQRRESGLNGHIGHFRRDIFSHDKKAL